MTREEEDKRYFERKRVFDEREILMGILQQLMEDLERYQPNQGGHSGIIRKLEGHMYRNKITLPEMIMRLTLSIKNVETSETIKEERDSVFMHVKEIMSKKE